MTFIHTVDTVISRSQVDIATLSALLTQVGSETLQGDAQTPFPVFDAVSGAWILQQTTANVDGVYVGTYQLAAADGCAFLQVVSVIAHTPPPSGASAEYVACNATTYTPLTNLSSLNGKQLKAFRIRSGTPFEVRVRLNYEWCHTFDFTQGSQGWFAAPDWRFGTYAPQGWGQSGANGYQAVCYIQRDLPSPTLITSIRVQASAVPPWGIIAAPYGFGEGPYDWQKNVSFYEWTGQVTTDSILAMIQESGIVGPTLTARITNVRVCGWGESPFLSS
ncbi:MAG: hypothetical protein SF162_20065 [bacterium]|nr:hypothetical protein [bacterium]